MVISNSAMSNVSELPQAAATADAIANNDDREPKGLDAASAPKGTVGPKRGARKPQPAVAIGQGTTPKKPRAPETKADLVLKKLRLAKGATLDQLIEVTAWQAHSVRGFLSGTVKKKLGLNLMSVVGKDNVRRYRIADGEA